MSRNYDNWERLVGAVLKREELWQLFHADSISASLSSESSSFSFSFGLASSIEDASFSSPEWSAANRKAKGDEIGSSTARDLVNDQPRSPNKAVTSKPFWKRALMIDVPKLRVHHHGAISPTKDSPKASPRMASPTPGSREHSAGVTPRHSRAGKGHSESPSNWPDDAKHEAHPLPLPPAPISNSSPTSRRNSAETSPSVPRTPERAENPKGHGSHWKKGKVLGRSELGYVYLGFNSEKGAMCAMKEVDLSFAKSKQSAKALEKEIALLSNYSHPNIVQYYGCETLGDNLYIYYEYMSGGTIHNLLKQYGSFGESAIRNYTRQILEGLAYLHTKTIAHREIKGDNILVDTNGKLKLTNLGVEKHILQITRLPRSALLQESPYWTAPEAIMNLDVHSLHMDIWSLGCTVVEMATSRPPMSKYDGGLAMFKVANKKELPTIPDHLSIEGKDFLRHCFQWNPLHRATASQLLEHPFVRNSLRFVKPTHGSIVAVNTESQVMAPAHAIHPSQASTSNHRYMHHLSLNTDVHTPRRYISAPVSPVGSPLPHPSSPQNLNGRISPPLISSPLTTSPIPYPHLNQSVLQSSGISSLSYWDPNILRGRRTGTPTWKGY